MIIAILGQGNVGTALAEKWLRAGHRIIFGSRNPDSIEHKRKAQDLGAEIKTVHAAVEAAEVVVLALPYGAAAPVLRMIPTLEKKIILDCTNPLKEDLSGLQVGFTTSGLEELQKASRGGSFYKAFNCIGAEHMRNPNFGDHKAIMFVCGDDNLHKPAVLKLVREIGFDVIDAGNAAVARLLEPFAMLWIHLAFHVGIGRNFGFGLLKK